MQCKKLKGLDFSYRSNVKLCQYFLACIEPYPQSHEPGVIEKVREWVRAAARGAAMEVVPGVFEVWVLQV